VTAGRIKRGDPDRFPCTHPRTPKNSQLRTHRPPECRTCHLRREQARSDRRRRAAGSRKRNDPQRYPCGHPRTAENTRRPGECVACDKDRRARRRLVEPGDAETAVYLTVIRTDPCSYCGGPAGAVDHIEPASAGGPNHWTNYTPACASCNGRKRTKPLLVFLLELAAA
jgi:hypothetical protein